MDMYKLTKKEVDINIIIIINSIGLSVISDCTRALFLGACRNFVERFLSLFSLTPLKMSQENR